MKSWIRHYSGPLAVAVWLVAGILVFTDQDFRQAVFHPAEPAWQTEIHAMSTQLQTTNALLTQLVQQEKRP